MRNLFVISGAIALYAASATADTITLNTGVVVEGTMKARDDGIYEVNAGGNLVFFRPDEIANIEKNDRDGRLNMDEVRAQAQAEFERLEKETGLSLDQRNRVDELLTALSSGTSGERLNARDALVRMNQEVSIVRYIKYWFSNLITPPLLEAIFYVSPSDAVPELKRGVEFTDANVRVKAIELLAQMEYRDSADLVARGLVDPVIDVQLAAIYALAKFGAKKASTALVELLAKPDVKISNTSQQALEAIWSGELSGQTPPKSLSDWNSFLRKHLSGGGVSLETLEPLVLPGQEFVMG